MERGRQPRKVMFASQAWAEAYQPRPTEAIISITNADAQPARLADGWCAVLRLSFDDVDPVAFPLDADDDAVVMRAEQARQIAAFVRSLPAECDAVAVHCRYGQSRSAAVARALCEHLRLQFVPDYEHDNRYVYESVARALRED